MKGFRAAFVFLVALAVLVVYSVYSYGDKSVFGRPLKINNFVNSTINRFKKLRSGISGLGVHLSAFLLSQGVLGSSSRTKTVLLWTPFFGESNWLPSLKELGCPVVDCFLTSNKSRLLESDAVIFHWRDVDVSKLPQKHLPQQRWLLLNEESPEHSPSNVLSVLGDMINWTVTYRRDSDIVAPYGIVRNKTLEEKMRPPSAYETVEESGKPRKLIAWLVSNCQTPGKRENFVEALKQYVPVSIYGKCGQQVCPVKNRLDCYNFLKQQYKFYLSFENSICKDYVTEKLFYAMYVGMVPIVFGGAEYEEILPPHSYIDALDFETPKELAEYLLLLDSNESLYNAYLNWRQDYIVEDRGFKWICDVCEKLDIPSVTSHHNLMSWFYDEANCRSWS